MISYRPFEPADVRRKPGDIVAHGVSVVDDDRLIATGGIVRLGTKWWTFSEIQPEARVAVRLHRLVMEGLRHCENLGMTPVYGYCDETKPRAKDWIERIGFRPITDAEHDHETRIVERWTKQSIWIREAGRGD